LLEDILKLGRNLPFIQVHRTFIKMHEDVTIEWN